MANFWMYNFVLFIMIIYDYFHNYKIQLTLQVISMPGQQEKCFLCGQPGHLAAECRGPSQADNSVELPPIHKKKYQVL